MRFLAVTCVRNEAAFLLDWVAHHKAVGFTDFLIFSNDCTDGTDKMLDRLHEMGELTHVRNDGPHDGGVQWTALNHAHKQRVVKQADWIASIDIDEYVNIRAGDHTLPALLAALPDATAITLTWRLFGNNNVVRFADTPVTDQFTMAAPAIMHWPWRASMFKTLFRNDGTYKKLGVHRPRSPNADKLGQARWFDGQGRELDAVFHTKRLFSPFGRDNYALVQLNHYALGSMESYVLKCDRGRSNREDSAMGMSYWVERNFAVVEDRSIDSIRPGSNRELARLKSDASLATLHDAAVVWRKKRFATLMLNDEYRSLFGRLMITPASRPLPPEATDFITGFARLAQKS